MVLAKTFLAVLMLALMSSGAFAQKPPLVITGAIGRVKVDGPLVRIDSKDFKYPYERKEPPYFSVPVRTQYCNQGDVTLIVPLSTVFRNERKKILFLELPATTSRVSDAVSGFPLSGFDYPMEVFLLELAKPEPSRNHFAIIEPGQCHESGDMIKIKSGYKLEVHPSADKREAPLELAIPEYSYFKIHYSLSMKDSLPISEAKLRWSKFGKLLTTADGDFFLETEFIVNKRPD